MNKKLLISTIFATTLITTTVYAEQSANNYTDAKKGTSFVTGAISGAILGGPVGFIAGALAGAYVGETIEDAEQYDVVSSELQVAQANVTQLENKLVMVEEHNRQYAQLVMEQLEFDMLFRTNESQLSKAGVKRLQSLGNFLANNPGIIIHLEGHADPRGKATYNKELSRERVVAVQSVLTDAGVDGYRIQAFNYGDTQSTALIGDYDSYAMERKVSIQLSTADSDAVARN